MDAESIYRVLKDGTVAERQALARALPPDPLRDAAGRLLDSERPGMAVVALAPVTISYCYGAAPDVGAELAKALHRLAVELFEGTPDHGLLPTTLSGLADNYVKASNLLGHPEEAVAFADKYIPFYERIGEPINLRSLKLGRIEALINLNRLDDAARALEDPSLTGDPAIDSELERLQARMRALLASISDTTEAEASSDDLAVDETEAGAGGDYLGVDEPSSRTEIGKAEVYDHLELPSLAAPAARPAPAPPPAQPTSVAPPAPPAPKSPAPRAPKFRLPWRKRPDRARPERAKSAPRPVSTGFASVDAPGDHIDEARPIAPGETYYFWLEVNEAPGSIEEKPTPLPTEMIPARARLTVVLFAPDRGFDLETDADLGELELQDDGSARVVVQPAQRRLGARAARLPQRLLFPLRASKTGDYRLRCCIYCQGVLVQSRLIEVEVGGTRRVSRVDYTLATRLNPATLATLPEHRFSIHANHTPGRNHDFYVFGGDGAFHDSITIAPGTLSGALEIARAALRRASWGDEEPWVPGKKYRYEGTPSIDTLREDLAGLAIAGWRIYDLLANQLAGGKSKVSKLAELVRQPGLVQISPDASLGMVLPAALIYDHQIEPQRKLAAEFELCAEFERAFRAKVPFEETVCCQGQCPSNGRPTTVCPSGFWGFRHGLGLPISEAEEAEEGEERETEFTARLEYHDVPVIVVGVSRAADLPRTRTHTQELLTLRPDWGQRAWLVEDHLDPLLELMRSKGPHVVYLYCHGSGRPVGSAEIPMLYLGDDPQHAKPGEWLERSMLRGTIEWTKPRPLVFLNGCHTAVLDAHTTLDFVTGFVQNSNACGVVGTEITVFEPLAGAFAKQFLTRFLAGTPVGVAIRDARRDLLQQGNPLGLVYTPFVLSGTQLVKA